MKNSTSLTKLGKRIDKNTIVNKVISKEVYFACINDLKGQVSEEELAAIKSEFTIGFNIVGIVRDYSKRGDKNYTPSKAKIQSNPSPTLYECLGTYENIQKEIESPVA